MYPRDLIILLREYLIEENKGLLIMKFTKTDLKFYTSKNYHKINSLPKSKIKINKFIISSDKDLKLLEDKKYLKYLTIGEKFSHKFYRFKQKINLSKYKNLVELILEDNFNRDIYLKENKKLKCLRLHRFNQQLDLSENKNLRHLSLGERFNQELNLRENKNLRSLATSFDFDKTINLEENKKLIRLTLELGCVEEFGLRENKKLEKLIFGFSFDQKISLKNNKKLRYLRFGIDFEHKLDLKENTELKKITLFNSLQKRLLKNISKKCILKFRK